MIKIIKTNLHAGAVILLFAQLADAQINPKKTLKKIQTEIPEKSDIKTNIPETGEIKREDVKVSVASSAYEISTVAGPGNHLSTNRGYRNEPGRNALFNEISGLVIDEEGNLYVAEMGNFCVRKVAVDLTVSTYAGKNEQLSRDGTLRLARFYNPASIWRNKKGEMLVADKASNAIRKITNEGTVVTVAGGNEMGNTDGSIAKAQFNQPVAAVEDSKGNIFVADHSNNRIRKISNGKVSTFAGSEFGRKEGTGTDAQFQYPLGLTIDKNDNLYMYEYNIIWKITPEGVVSVLAGSFDVQDVVDGKGDWARFYSIRGITIDDNGNLYVTDGGTDQSASIRMINPMGEVRTLVGAKLCVTGKPSNEDAMKDGNAAGIYLEEINSLCIDAGGNIYFADYWYNCIRKLSLIK
ncbi:MAG TPA: hypothetical protein VD905_04650 [Flavobacteriales bacterium]|nr:hypothetical protein [Flavobacteriales bacterium]